MQNPDSLYVKKDKGITEADAEKIYKE